MTATTFARPHAARTVAARTLPRRRTAALLSPAILGTIMIVALFLYGQAASGPAQWADGGFFLVRAATVAMADLPNDALSHPLYHLYLSAVVAAVGPVWACYGNALLTLAVLPLIYLGGRWLGGGPVAAGLATAGYALALPVTFLATRNEVYPLHALTLAAAALATIAALERRSVAGLFGAGLLLGLTVLVHQMSLIAILFSLIAVALTMRRLGMAMAAAWFAGLSLAGIVTIAQIAQASRPEDLAGLIEAIRLFLVVTLDAGGEFAAESYAATFFDIPGSLASKGALLVCLFSFFGVMLAGAWAMLRGLGRGRPTVALVAWPALGTMLFVLTYNTADKFTFALPTLVLLSMLAAPALEGLGRRQWLAVPLVVAQPLIGLAAVMAVQAGVTLPDQPDTAPFRDNISFWLSPLQRDNSAERFAAHYAALVPPGGAVLADYVPRQALRSAQLTGLFPDRRIVGDVHLLMRDGVATAYVPRLKNLGLREACLRPAAIGFVLDVACEARR